MSAICTNYGVKKFVSWTCFLDNTGLWRNYTLFQTEDIEECDIENIRSEIKSNVKKIKKDYGVKVYGLRETLNDIKKFLTENKDESNI